MPSLNVVSYIHECMESVVNQALKEIEILCVDAGSIDGTLEVLEEYAAKDGRIRIIHSDRKSYGYQVNLGIDAATGDYVGIVETDDFILPEMYKDLYEIANRECADICKGDFQRFWGAGDKRTFEYGSIASEGLYNKILNIKDDPSILWCNGLNQTGIYSLPFLREKNVRLNESPGASYQDNGFWFQVTIQADRVYYVNKAYYMLRRDNPNSSVRSSEKVYCMCEEYDFIREFLHKHVDLETRFAPYVAYFRMGNYFFTLNRIAPEYKLEFLKRFAEDFHTIEAAGELDKKLYTGQQWEELHDIMECPEFVYYRDYYQDGRVLAEINQQKERADRLQYDLDCVHNSVSFRAGRAITWLPRKLRGGIRCYQEHGSHYTFDRGLIHLRLKEDPEYPKNRDYAYYSSLPTRKYPGELMLWYKQVTGEDLDLRTPKTFNEKIQWMKLYDATPLKTRLADKYLVREWVKEKIGEEYLVPLLGVWDSFDEINFDMLPNQFALKANHGSGWNIIVHDKSSLDREAAKNQFDDWMHSNYAFVAGFELQYMNIPPKIIAEKYIENAEGLKDYRFYCFNGKPMQVWVDIYSGTPNHRRSIYDMEWNLLPMKCTWPDGGELLREKPKSFEKMKEFAALLCQDFAFVRVDFFDVDGKLYMGEMTFTPMSGLGRFEPAKWDRELGDTLRLPPMSPIPKRRST